VAIDQFIVSNDGGNTWRIVPRVSPLTGAQSIPAFDNNWAIASLPDTQESAATAVNFGDFLAGDSETKTIWIINRTLDITTLTFSVLDQLNNLSNGLNNILEISITGIANNSGTGTLNTSFNDTKIYSRNVAGSGLFTLTSNNPSAIKVELQLVNYPLSGLSENIDYQLSIVPNGIATPDATVDWINITGTPTTLAGYGITDGVSDTREVATSGSLTGGGNLSANRTLSLVNDDPTPGNNTFYGTNGSGTKGFFTLGNFGLITNTDTSGTIEKTAANTIGTYTVTAAAKTVLDDATISDMRTTLEAFTDRIPLTLPPEGLVLSWVNNTTVGISSGRAIVPVASSDRRIVSILTSNFTKTINATFAVGTGNGGRVGSLTANTTYHVFIAQNSSGTVDIFFDTSVTGANFPTGFSNRRRIGSVLTDGSSNIKEFTQIYNTFILNPTIVDFSGVVPNSTSNLLALTVPSGLAVEPIINYNGASLASGALIRTGTPGSGVVVSCNFDLPSGTQRNFPKNGVYTNTNRQIRWYADSGSHTFSVFTIGWVDPLY
jgi:hypothetical protein